MKNAEMFWSASQDELKQGYIEGENQYVCLLCGNEIEKGVVYPKDGVLYEAKRYMRIHIEHAHHSVFEYLIDLDKKLTGLTDHQNRLLRLFYQGKNDAEVQEEMGIGSPSTIRNHRFVLKEKERQAKLFLALMELLKDKDEHAPAFIPLHQKARMVDDRYNVTEDGRVTVLKKYFPKGSQDALKSFPPKEKQRLIILQEIMNRFENERKYEEKEINQILGAVYHDHVLLRRYLIEYGFLDRKPDGSQYWLKK
ncbi:hypothetical protein SRABI84_05013 [Peribacillus simplex]|uniref:DUF2087 domain-containing protein n=1 Tax=Peribacillus simplex TaxID=1478 RepID=UPI001D542C8F|nr:DUF2087 domain-containing protein [Peribacillus simplex]CAH0314913.1 hypothetical protein SRABI84_05013 [Peribacillus simplex]